MHYKTIAGPSPAPLTPEEEAGLRQDAMDGWEGVLEETAARIWATLDAERAGAGRLRALVQTFLDVDERTPEFSPEDMDTATWDALADEYRVALAALRAALDAEPGQPR